MPGLHKDKIGPDLLFRSRAHSHNSQQYRTVCSVPAVRLYSFLPTAIEGGEVSASRLGHSLPSGKTHYPLYRRLGGPQGQSGQVRKISPPPWDSIPGPSSP